MTEWPKVHDWKSCVARTATEGSNPSLSAIAFAVHCFEPWGSSSVGRAPGSQSGGRGFDPHLLHHIFRMLYILGRARWGDSGALYPQSAIAGSNSHQEVSRLWTERWKVVSKVRFCATHGFRTPSGPEGSSGRNVCACAAELSDWS